MDSTPEPLTVLPYSAPGGPRRVSFIWMIGWCSIAEVLAIEWIIASQEGFRRLFNRTNTGMTSLFVVLTGLSFIGSLALFRPSVHPRRWPPFALAFMVGISNVFGWMVFKSVVLRIIQSFPFFLKYVVAWTLIPFCTSVVFLLLYRLTLDRSRQSSEKATP